MQTLCPRGSKTSLPNFDTSFNFSSDYRLRIYTSGCYYLDRDQNWRSDGLWVSLSRALCQNRCQSGCFCSFLLSSGWFIDKPLSYAMLLHSFNHLYQQFLYFAAFTILQGLSRERCCCFFSESIIESDADRFMSSAHQIYVQHRRSIGHCGISI